MKLIDRATGETVVEILTNHSMATDEVLDFFGITLDDEGQLIDEAGEPMGHWYDDLEVTA